MAIRNQERNILKCYHSSQVEFLTSNGRYRVETMFELKTTCFNTMRSYYLSQKPKLMGKIELFFFFFCGLGKVELNHSSIILTYASTMRNLNI